VFKGGFVGNNSSTTLDGKNNRSENEVKPDIEYDRGTGGPVQNIIP
jgi:hypothetical protein